jgi:hypothetical protein
MSFEFSKYNKLATRAVPGCFCAIVRGERGRSVWDANLAGSFFVIISMCFAPHDNPEVSLQAIDNVLQYVQKTLFAI